MEFIYEYGLFLLKAVTFVIAFAVVIGLIAKSSSKSDSKGSLEITNLSLERKKQSEEFKDSFLSKEQLKAKRKAQKNNDTSVPIRDNKVYKIDFKGGIMADEAKAMTEEINGILSQIDPSKDQVLINLESAGGTVVGYGYAASQISRLKKAGVKVIVTVDKVAASGGYMMACIADELYASPFSVIGSIGVVAEFPNYNKLLDKIGVSFEQYTAGKYKRTISPYRENSEESKSKFKESLEDTHTLFKEHVLEYRPQLRESSEDVFSGDHWYGKKALELGLIDDLKTSTEIVSELIDRQFDVIEVKYKKKKKFAEKLASNTTNVLFAKFEEYINSKRYTL